MARWQYATLRQVNTFSEDEWHRAYYFKGPADEDDEEELSPLNSKSSLPVLTRLGEEGWEVIHIEIQNYLNSLPMGQYAVQTTMPLSRIFWLKRQVS